MEPPTYNKSFTFLVPQGRLAQLEERQLDMLEVGGSRPSPPTNGFWLSRGPSGIRAVDAEGALDESRIGAVGYKSCGVMADVAS